MTMLAAPEAVEATPDPALRPHLRFVFPSADPPAVAPPARLDLTVLLGALSREFGSVCGQHVTVSQLDAAAAPPSTGFARDDGTELAIDVPIELCAALVNLRHGGVFEPGGPLPAPSALRVRSQFHVAALRATDLSWTGHGEWSPSLPAGGHVAALCLTVAGHVFELAIAVRLAPSPVAPSVRHRHDPMWSGAVLAAVRATRFDIRAVLHDRPIRLSEAARIQVGDVLPVDALRDVVLRVAAASFARGTIASDGTGGHEVTILGSTGFGRRLPTEQEQP